eukprot:jgi/Bigna1/70089/fgenesh1_pg.10_\
MQDEIISRRVLKMALGEKGFHRVIDSFAKVFQLEDSIRKKGQAPLSKGGNPAFARCQTTIGELLHDLSGSLLPVPKGSPPPSPHPNSKKKIIASNKYQLAPIDRVQDFLHIALKRMEDLSLRLAQQAEGDGRDKPPISEQKSDSSSNNNSAGAENKSSSAVKAGKAKTSTRVDPKFKKGNMVLYKGVKARVVGVHYESESYTLDCGSKRTPNVLFESANIKHLGRSKNTSNSSTGSGNTASRQQQQQQQNNDEKNRIRNNKGNRTEGAGDEDEKSQNFETAEARVHVPKAGSAVTTATIGKELGKDWSLEIPGDTSLFGAVAVGHFLLGTCNKARREGKAVDVAAYISDFQRVCQRSNDNDPRPNFNSVLDVGDQFLRLFAQKAIMGNKEYLAKIKRDMNYVRRPTSKDVFSEYIKGLILKGDAAQDSKSNDDGHNNNGDDSTEDRKHAAFAHLGIRNSQPSLGLSRMLTAIASFVATPIRIDIDSNNGTTEFLHLRWLSHKRRFAVVSNVPSPKTKDGGSIAKTKMPPLVRERKDGGGEAKGGGGEGIKGRAMLPLVSPKKKVNGERKGDRETGTRGTERTIIAIAIAIAISTTNVASEASGRKMTIPPPLQACQVPRSSKNCGADFMKKMAAYQTILRDGKSTDGGGGGGSPRSKPRSIERMGREFASPPCKPRRIYNNNGNIDDFEHDYVQRRRKDEDTKQLFNPLQLTLDESIKDEDDSIIGVLDLGPRMPEPIDIIVDVKANCSSRLTVQ